MTYLKALTLATEELEAARIPDAGTDAWLLLSHVCKINRTFYYVHMKEIMDPEDEKTYLSLLGERKNHVPLQYLTGEQEFMGLKFQVSPAVLIPRQDTETLVEEAEKFLRPGMRILDMCTGSGCILISLLKRNSGIIGVGTDISEEALAVARKNAKTLGTDATWRKSDLFDEIEGHFDLIVSNPPYIRTDVIAELMPEVREFEPFGALDGKEDGLFFYRRIVKAAPQFLNAEGVLLFEIGYDQGEAVKKLMEAEGFSEVVVIKDLSGNDRVVTGCRKEP